MKRIVLFMVAMFATVSYSYAQETQDKIYFDDVLIPQGGSATLVVNLKSADNKYAGLQCDFTLPTGVTATKITSASRVSSVLDPITEEKAFTVKMADNTTFYRVLIFNDIKASIPGNDGEVAYITVTADADVALGEYEGTLKGITMTTADKQEFSSADATFTVTITDRQILDENSTIAPVAADNVKVKVLRTIKAGNWGTICLPFAMTGEQVAEAFGSDVEFADFNGYEIVEDDDANIVGITVKFNSVDASSGLAANHPCIIKVKNNVSEFNVDNVTIEPEEDPTIAAVKRTKRQWSEMIGTYVAEKIVGDEEGPMLYLANNKFYYSKGTAKMKAFRAYFDFYDVLPEFDPNAAKVGFSVDDEATTIDGMGYQRIVDGVYDLSGRKIKLEDGDVTKLQKGVYIIDGKKVTIK